MNSEELRKACELARMDVDNDAQTGEWFAETGAGALDFDQPDERAWIESRCASVLVGMVREQDDVAIEACFTSWLRIEQTGSVATDEQRIRAAYFALTGEEL